MALGVRLLALGSWLLALGLGLALALDIAIPFASVIATTLSVPISTQYLCYYWGLYWLHCQEYEHRDGWQMALGQEEAKNADKEEQCEASVDEDLAVAKDDYPITLNPKPGQKWFPRPRHGTLHLQVWGWRPFLIL